MPGNFKQDDLRIKKTHKALLEALPKLLSKRNFGRITVNDICEESQMSRTAFYTHYNDKYDLLRSWLTKRAPNIALRSISYMEMEETINKAVDINKNIITNLFVDANNETIELINEFISSLLDEFMGINNKKESDPFYIVLYSFCTGGIINLILWQVKNKYPIDLRMINIYFYQILDAIRQVENNREDGVAKNGK